MSSYRGRSARVSTARMIVWEILNQKGFLTESFTCREFYVKNKSELETRISKEVPGASVEAVVKGALRGLGGKGLLVVGKSHEVSGVTSAKSVYTPARKLIGLSYGEALVEAQRRRIG